MCSQTRCAQKRGAVFFLSTDLLIPDNLALERMTAHQSEDMCELVTARHRSSSFVITSNGAVGIWLVLYHTVILGDSAMNWLAPRQLPDNRRQHEAL